MLRGAALVALALAAAGCGIRAPSRVDHAALVAKLGAVEARRTLELRVLHRPGDLAARLALAALDEEVGRPSAAIEQLEIVQTIGGPIGTRWHAEDRARLARLLAARGNARLARSSPTALADLLRARGLGATVDERTLASARRARALIQLRHVDAKERAAGHLVLRELMRSPVADPAWAISSPSERGTYGAWLWQAGARRAAWEELAAWHAATAPPRDPTLQAAYLVALAWWSPHDAPPPPADDLVGPERCRFGPAAGCDAGAILETEPAALPDLLAAPVPAAPAPAPPGAGAHAAAVVGYVRARVPSGPPAAALAPLVAAYARDPAITDRLALDAIATAPDAAAAHAALGALFEALADPARSRAAWQAAVDADPDPAFLRSLALATARARDPDAALVHATAAAAASGDPALVWTAIARVLDDAGSHVHALEAARYAIELAGRDAVADALDAAISASASLGRTTQAAALAARRATVAPPPAPPRDDPTDAASALAAHRARPTAATADRLWVAARWNPRSVALRAALRAALAPDDPRLRILEAELLSLAADPDAALALTAVAALR